jgi:PEGA domain
MNINSMRSLLFMLLGCLVIAGTVAAATSIEASSVGCTDDSYAGLTGGTGIGVVEVSGHGDTSIDGIIVEPVGVGTYKGYETRWYPTTEGSHKVYITRQGYYAYTSYMTVCSGKVSYVYYDQASHPIPGMAAAGTTTAPPTVNETNTTYVPAMTESLKTTTYTGQSADLKAALAGGAQTQQGSFGSLSITTDPAGATIYVDGVTQGITPATIPGLSAGSHTLVLKLEGYDDLTLPVTISAGSTQYYSSALKMSGAASYGAATTRKSGAPGFEAAFAAWVICVLFLYRKTRP